jgi:RHS repeat-associated protein
VAVYAADLSGFDASHVRAPGGTDVPLAGGAGTVYLKRTADARGTLVIDAVGRGAGVTPLGLPGEASHTFTDDVVIRGSRTNAAPATPGMPLIFQNTLTIENAGALQSSGDVMVLGTLIWNAGQSVGARTLSLPGTAEVHSGTLVINSAVPQISGNTLIGGTWEVFSNATLTISTVGPLLSNQAHVTLISAGSNFTNLNGFADNPGSFELLGGRTFTTTADFRNSGNLTLGPASTLNVTGAYTQAATGSLSLEIGGTPASGKFGGLSASGLDTLAGSLNISLVNNYGPSVGQSYQVMTFGSRLGNFSNISGLRLQRTGVLTADITDTHLALTCVVSAADLAVQDITNPARGVSGQNAAISYTVQNQSNTAAVGTWVDSVYLSASSTLTPSAKLVTRVNHVGGVAAMGTYTETVTAPLPGAVDGNYHFIVVADSQGRVPDSNRDNNVLASPSVLAATTPALALGVPTSGTIATNQDVYFRVDVPPATDVRLTANFTGTPRPELYVRYGDVPDPAHYDQVSANLNDLHPQVLLTGRAGTYYILLHGREGAGGGQPFTITAEGLNFRVTGISPNHGSNAGQATATVTGAGFSPGSAVSLVAGGTVRPASQVLFKDSNTLFAAFDLTGLTAGAYDVRVVDQGRTTTLPGAFTVNTGTPGQLQVHISSPSGVRNSAPNSLLVEYANAGETDIPAPLLTVMAQNAVLRRQDQPDYVGNQIQLLGISTSGPAGVLPPGARGSISLIFSATPFHVGSQSTFTVLVGDEPAPIDWASLKAGLRPATVPADAWDPIFANFTATVGTTVSQYQAALDDEATYLSQLGDYTNDVSRLYAFALDQGNDSLPQATLASAIDASAPQPGMPLTFERTYHQPLSERFRLGPLGRGWTDQWDSSATADAQGNVTIERRGAIRFFQGLSNGTYQGLPGDDATLTLQAGSYRLRETDGSLSVYRTDGLLDYVQDTHGNRITLGYVNGRLTTLTHSSGAHFSLHYNAQGRIDQLTDEAGGITTYTYDPSGEHLLRVSGPNGTTAYTYATGLGAAREHALTSITNPDNTHLFFNYDDRGRLIGQHRDGGLEPITYNYVTSGGYTTTDGTKATTTLLLDDMGQIAQMRDPLGHVLLFGYDADMNLVQTTAPGNVVTTYRYDSQGNLTSQVDALGHEIDMTYEPTFNQLTSLRDARGNTTRYDYDQQGNLLAITYPDSSSQEQFSYDPLGNLTETINGRGDPIHYTYDDQGRGLVKRKDYADGTHIDFTYDDRGNLRTATDASGTTTLDWDRVADRLMKITYPGGRFLQFFYERGGDLRTRMVDQSGFTVVYDYYDDGNLKELGDGQNNLIVHYTYDPAGRLRRKDLGNGTYTTYEYDPAGQLLHLVNHAPDGTVNSRFDYEYDDSGRRTTMTTLEGRTSYEYDLTGQLTKVTLPDGRVIQYQYDAAGNRLSVTDNGVTMDYVTNDLNQYTDVGTAHFTYDADGNLITKQDGNQYSIFTYNADNLLTGAVTPEGTWAYEYDPFGNRKASVHNGQRTEYIVDPLGLVNVVGEYHVSGNLLARYTYGVGLTSRINASGASAYYDFDAIGSTVGLTGTSGAYVSRYSNLPFGERLSATETIVNPFAYIGQWGVMTEDNGLAFMRARYYNANLGRFAQNDPIGLIGGDVNILRYVVNSPCNAIDPAGLDTQQEDVDQSPIEPMITHSLPDSFAPLGEIVETLKVIPGVIRDRKLIKQHNDEIEDAERKVLDIQIEPYHNHLPDPIRILKQLLRVIHLGSGDPNELIGPAGFGARGFVTPDQTLPYTIRFENIPTATAPAQKVVITEQLDPHLDFSTFELGDFGFGNLVVHVPEGRTFFSTRVDARGTLGVFVDVAARLDLMTGLVTWTFTSVDPVTLDLPTDPLAGFLPPDHTSPEGEGFVSYRVRPKASLGTGTLIDAKATVVFDENAPIDTRQVFNTIDSGPPTSSVNPLPALAPASFPVSWSGNDDPGGSGVASFDLFVSTDGGPFAPWLTTTAQTSATFSGALGHTYTFYSLATDNVGNRQPTPTGTASTRAVLPPGFLLQGTTLTVTGSGPNDSFQFTPGTAYVVTLNGVSYAADPALVRSVAFVGQGGNAAAAVSAGGAAQARLLPGTAHVTGSGFSVDVSGMKTITVVGGAGSTATLGGAPAGGDVFVGTPAYSYLYGSGFWDQVNGFPVVVASTTAGNDPAYLYDSAGDDVFVGTPAYAYLSGTGFWNQANGFRSVTAISAAGGSDRAYLYGAPAGGDVFVGTSSYAYLDGTGFFNLASGFPTVQGYSTAGGNDSAFLFGAAAGGNTFVATPAYAYLYGPGFFALASGFPTVFGYAGAAGDRADLYSAAAGGSAFVGLPTYSYLSGGGRWEQANGFQTVVAHSQGANDTAYLYDSPGDDVFVTAAAYAYLYGPGFFNEAGGFRTVLGYSMGGSDRAYLYGTGTSADTLVDAGSYVYLYGDAFTEVASAFGFLYVNPMARHQ